MSRQGAPAVAALIVLGVSVAYGQQKPDTSDRAVATARAWSLLEGAIKSTVVSDQSAAIQALAATNTPRARAMVERIARDTSHSLRAVAIRSLPTSDATYLPVIADALQESDLDVRRAAIQQLGWIRDVRVLPPLQSVIMRGDVDTIETAIGSARLLGKLSFGILVQAVQSGGERSREAAIRCIEVLVSGDMPSTDGNLEALHNLRPQTVLVKALGDGNPAVRAFAALILARLGDAAGADELHRIVDAADPRVGTIVSRYHAMAALVTLGRTEYLQTFATAIASADPRVRLDAAMAMRSFASPSMEEAWNETWRSDSPSDVRYWAFHGLIALRRNDTGLLRAGLVDRDPSIRLRAAERLLTLGPDSASVDVLAGLAIDRATRNLGLSFLSKADPTRAATVARALLPKTAEDLARMRSGPQYDPDDFLSVVFVLETVKDRTAVPALAALLDLASDPNLGFRVMRALVAIDDDSARRALIGGMDDSSSTIRIYAAAGVLSE